jgi:glycosyltransferase involved in cell wall biosynthesis
MRARETRGVTDSRLTPSAGDGRRPRVSVIVPTRNGARRLPILLDALERQTMPPDDFEVIIADDHSTDDTVAVGNAHPLSRVVSATAPAGQPGVSNLGIRASRAPVIAFTDDDTIPAPDWLERGLERVMAAPTGLIAGHIELALDEPPTAAALVDLGRGYLDQAEYAEQGFGATANLWARREVLDRLNWFDERFVRQGHDRDFGERALEADLAIVYAPDVVVVHPARSRARELARVAFRLGRGQPELRDQSVGRLRELRPPWTQPRYYRPWRRVWGLSRVRSRGYHPTLRERLAMRVIQYTCVQLPLVAGSVVGATRDRSRRAARRD